MTALIEPPIAALRCAGLAALQRAATRQGNGATVQTQNPVLRATCCATQSVQPHSIMRPPPACATACIRSALARSALRLSQ